MLRFRLESARSELESATLHMGTAITDIGDTAITRAAITAITGVTHIIEPTTVGGPITMAIDITSITSVIITATKARRLI